VTNDNDTQELAKTLSFGPLERIECVLCGSNRMRTVVIQKWFGEDFHVVRCSDCRLIYTNPRPTEQWRERFYDPRHNLLMERLNRDFIWLSDQRRMSVYSVLLEFLTDELGARGKLLDAGCAGGHFVKMASEYGFDASGFDASPGAIAYAREHLGLELIQADASRIPVPDNSYDVVKEIKRILKPEGILFVETVNYLKMYLVERYFAFLKPLYFRIMNREIFRWGQSLPWFPFKHYCHWTPKSLMMVLRKAGFEQCRLHFINNYNTRMWSDDRLLLYLLRRGYNDVIRFLLGISGNRLNLWGALLATAENPKNFYGNNKKKN